MTISYKNFSAEEDHLIREGLTSVDMDVQLSVGLKRICLLLGKPFHVVTQRAFQLGIIQYGDFHIYLLSHRQDGWRSDEIDAIFNNLHATRKQLAKALDRSVQSVNKKFVEFCLKEGGTAKPWEENEKELLGRIINNTPMRAICNTLMREAIDVKYTAIRLGMTKSGVKNQFSGRIPKAAKALVIEPQTACL